MEQKKLTRAVASRIYRNAAQKMLKKQLRYGGKMYYVHDYACHALASAFVEEFHGLNSKYTAWTLPSFNDKQNWQIIKGAFIKKFKPEKAHEHDNWFGSPSYSLNRNARILALLTMAQNHSIRS